MKVVIQRVSEASVQIVNRETKSIHTGYLLLLGFATEDTNEDVKWIVNKVLNLRIFSDEKGLMNLNINEVNGELLCISQFTLHAKVKKGNRPSFISAAKPEKAEALYNLTISEFEKLLSEKVETGIFGADMKVNVVNEGPVTILIDSKNKI